MSETVRARAIEGLLLMLGLIVGGWVLGSQIKATRLADRYVTVRGLVERKVKSDLAIWSLSFSETGGNLQSVLAKSEQDQGIVTAFLKKQGFAADEIAVGDISVTDRSTQMETRENPVKPESRFIVSQSIALTTKSVDRAAGASSKTADLVRAGVILSQSSVSYFFTGLNSLKPDMITEATRNARTAATRFAQDSGSEVGAIRSARQGVFSISAADAASSGGTGEDNGGSSGDSSIMKNIRVVTTVDYYLVR